MTDSPTKTTEQAKGLASELRAKMTDQEWVPAGLGIRSADMLDLLAGLLASEAPLRHSQVEEIVAANLREAGLPASVAPSEEQIERAAIVLYERGWKQTRTWERDATEAGKISFRNQARDVLTAAGVGSPVIATEAKSSQNFVSSAQVDETKLRESLREVLAGQEAMHCTRVWEAWQVGTMSADDFSLVVEDEDAFEEIVQAALNALRGGAQ